MQVAFFAPPAVSGPTPAPASPAGDAATATFDAFLTASATGAAATPPAAPTPPGVPPPAEDCADPVATLEAWLAANAAPGLPPVPVPPRSAPDESIAGDTIDSTAAASEPAETAESESAVFSDVAEFGVATPVPGRSKAAPPTGPQPSRETQGVPVVGPPAAGDTGGSVPTPEPERAVERDVEAPRRDQAKTTKVSGDTGSPSAAASVETVPAQIPAMPVSAPALPSAAAGVPSAAPARGGRPSAAANSGDAPVAPEPVAAPVDPSFPLSSPAAQPEASARVVPLRGPNVAVNDAPAAAVAGPTPAVLPVADLPRAVAAALPAATANRATPSLAAAPASAARARPEADAAPGRESFGRAARYAAVPADLQVTVTTREGAGTAAAREPVTAPVFAPAAAAPTLAQILVETGAGRSPVSPKAADAAASDSLAASSPPPPAVSAVDARPLAAPVVTTAGSLAAEPATAKTPPLAPASTGGEGVRPVGTAPGTARPVPEKLAAVRGKSGGTLEESAGTVGERNFLPVDKQGVGEQGPRSGTTIAEGAENMPALSTASAPASAALDLVEAPAVTQAVAAKDLSGAVVRLPHATHSAGTAAAAAVQETLTLAERTQEAGRNHVELRVQTAGDEHLRVHLRWHDGVIETRFVTETADLQQALSREWARVVPQLADKGLRFGEATFERRDQQPSDQSSAQNAFTFDQQQHSPRGQKQAFAGPEDAAAALPLTTLRGRSPAVRGVQPATTSNPPPPPTTPVRNLRAWA